MVADGIRFDSEKEWRRYTELQLALKSGLIAHLKVHPRFDIVVNGEKVCTYIADFVYLVPARVGRCMFPKFEAESCFEKIVEDTKGFRTKEFILKKKLMKAVHKIDVREI